MSGLPVTKQAQQERQQEPEWEVTAAAPLLVDVREPDEWVGPLGHVAAARLVPLGRLAAQAHALAAAAGDRPIVAVCRSGARSLTAAAILRRAGLRGARSLRGGMLQWNALGLPVER